LKSLDAKLKSAPVAAGTLGELVGEGSSARLVTVHLIGIRPR
jgi:hypothetical protein